MTNAPYFTTLSHNQSRAMIAVARGRIETADLADVDRFNAAVSAKADQLGELLKLRHGPGECTHTSETDLMLGGVIVRVEWRAVKL